jgi:STE24 endopeptidase
MFLLAAGSLVSAPVQNLVSRQVEARADLHALDLTGEPEAFVAMQERLATTNISDPDPPAAWHWFFGSHPTVAERIAMAHDWERLRP